MTYLHGTVTYLFTSNFNDLIYTASFDSVVYGEML